MFLFLKTMIPSNWIGPRVKPGREGAGEGEGGREAAGRGTGEDRSVKKNIPLTKRSPIRRGSNPFPTSLPCQIFAILLEGGGLDDPATEQDPTNAVPIQEGHLEQLRNRLNKHILGCVSKLLCHSVR